MSASSTDLGSPAMSSAGVPAPGVAAASGSGSVGHSVLKPQSYLILVVDDSLGSCLHNTITLETKVLGGKAELELDPETGLAFVDHEDERCVWAVDLMSLHVFADSQGTQFLYRDDCLVGSLGTLHARHDIIEIGIARMLGCQTTKVQSAAFHFDQFGGRLGVNVSDLWQKMKFTCSPGSGAKFFQNRRSRWLKMAALFVLGDLAVRGSLPYCKDGAIDDESRCLVFSSISLSLLLLQSICSAHASSRCKGMVENVAARAGFARIVATLLGLVKAGQQFDLRLGEDVHRLGSRPSGSHPASVIVLVDRKVKLAGSESVRLPEHLQRQVQQYRLLELDGLDFEDFIIRLVMLVLNNKKPTSPSESPRK